MRGYVAHRAMMPCAMHRAMLCVMHRTMHRATHHRTHHAMHRAAHRATHHVTHRVTHHVTHRATHPSHPTHHPTQVPGVEGLKTFGAEPGQSYCGGTGCVFSAGFLRSFPPSEVFREGTMCQGCTRGQQDVALSRCLFHHHPAATAPIGITGFFWGRPADRLIEQMLKFYPKCAEGGAAGGGRQQRCVRQHGLMDWFSAHLQIRGAFTTLYHNLTPAVWAGMFREHDHMKVDDLLRLTHTHYEQTAALRASQRRAWAARTCCAMVHRAFVGCSFGCAPWRQRPTPSCSTGGDTARRLPGNSKRRDGARRRRRSSAATSAIAHDPHLWWSPEPAEAEAGPLKNHHAQFWDNGVMRCEFCGGWFNGWRGK